MLFQFAPAIQAGIETGKYLQVFSNGIPVAMVRDAVSGQFVAHAIGATINNSPLSALVAAPNLLMSGVQMYQTHKGFTAVLNGLQTLQTSLGVLQATTALIGVGTVAGVALTAVNLHQTLKLRKEVEQMRLEVKNGFIDLKQALKDQGAEIRQLIEQVAQDIKFEQHRTILIRAYGLFIQAMNRFRSAMQLQDIRDLQKIKCPALSNIFRLNPRTGGRCAWGRNARAGHFITWKGLSRRNAEIDGVRGMFFEALADYTNPHLLSETCAAGQLRRLECAWAIEQGIVATYLAQNEMSAVSDRLYHLQNTISENACMVIDSCDSYDELDFLFPEISRIRNHDFAVIETWHNQVDWMRSLPSSELKLLNSTDFNTSEFNYTPDIKQGTTALALPEQVAYENLSEKSHFYSLRDQLRFMFKPALRRDYEAYVNQQAGVAGYRTLVPKNLQQASDLTVANLYRDLNKKEKKNKV